MDINLDVAYFLNTENWHLSKEVQQIFDKRERKCKKKGTCLDLCTPKANENAKHPPK